MEIVNMDALEYLDIFELDEGYHAIAQKRIAEALAEQEGEDAWMG